MKRGRPPAPVKPAILSGLLNDDTLKCIAMECGMSHSYVTKTAVTLGFRRMYVTDTERREIMANRTRRVAA